MNTPQSTHVAWSEGGVATITIAGGGHLNLLSTAVIESTRSAFEEIIACETLRVVILRGTGEKAFVAGADIREMGVLTPETARNFIEGLRKLCEAVRQCPVPVIARVSGWALGGGLELMAACDLRVASNRAQFGMPEIKVGIPSIIHAALLPGVIGQARANWMLLTGDNIDAAQALSWSLVDTVMPLERLDEEVGRLANQLASYGRHVVRQQKRLLREWRTSNLDAAIVAGVGEFASAFGTGEPQRYMAKFLDRK